MSLAAVLLLQSREGRLSGPGRDVRTLRPGADHGAVPLFLVERVGNLFASLFGDVGVVRERGGRGRRSFEDLAFELGGTGLALLEIGGRAVEPGRVDLVVVVGSETECALVGGKLIPRSTSAVAARARTATAAPPTGVALAVPVDRATQAIFESAAGVSVLYFAPITSISTPGLELAFLSELGRARDVGVGPERVGRRGRRAGSGGLRPLRRKSRVTDKVYVGVLRFQLYEVFAVQDERRFRGSGGGGGVAFAGGKDGYGLPEGDREVACVWCSSSQDARDAHAVFEGCRNRLTLSKWGACPRVASVPTRCRGPRKLTHDEGDEDPTPTLVRDRIQSGGSSRRWRRRGRRGSASPDDTGNSPQQVGRV